MHFKFGNIQDKLVLKVKRKIICLRLDLFNIVIVSSTAMRTEESCALVSLTTFFYFYPKCLKFTRTEGKL